MATTWWAMIMCLKRVTKIVSRYGSGRFNLFVRKMGGTNWGNYRIAPGYLLGTLQQPGQDSTFDAAFFLWWGLFRGASGGECCWAVGRRGGGQLGLARARNDSPNAFQGHNPKKNKLCSVRNFTMLGLHFSIFLRPDFFSEWYNKNNENNKNKMQI